MEKTEEMSGRTLPEMLAAYAAVDPARFHMPGHKGRGMDGFWRGDLPGWDVTELSCTDNLHAPEGAIARTQEMIAKTYGAAHAFLSVNGSTAAVQAMILSLSPDDRLLLSRDAHRSAIAGAALSGVPTDFIEPVWHADAGLYGMVDANALDAALTRTGATAVLLTAPNFLGLCADLPALSRTAHAHGALLLLDAAHGAHFPFSELLPDGPAGYADLWAHSQHKTMDALTQTASLQLADCRVTPERVQRALAMVETSSPSYLLMASLDWSVFMARRRDWTAQVRRCRKLAQQIDALPGLATLKKEAVDGGEIAACDETRLVIDVSGRGLSGFFAQAALERAGVYVEMADARRLVLITTPADDPAWYDRLLCALKALPMKPVRRAAAEAGPVFGPRRMGLREAVFARQTRVPLKVAAGRITGEAFGLYPPGVAASMPGETIPPETVRALETAMAQGAHVFGIRDGCISAVEE